MNVRFICTVSYRTLLLALRVFLMKSFRNCTTKRWQKPIILIKDKTVMAINRVERKNRGK